MSDLTGKTVAGYPIEKLLAKGSYSDSWQIGTSGAKLAVKILRENLRTDAKLGEQISKGWELSRAAAHENLVTAFGAGVDSDVGAYCLQELIAGKSLRQNMLDGAKLAWRDFLIIGEQLFTALNTLHAAGIIHGDIWTGSILITQDQDVKLEGAGGLMYLTRRASELISGNALGYQAPEILKGSPVSVEGDIYAAGGCLYAVLAGNDPYPPESAERLVQIVADRKLPRVTGFRDDLPPEADEILGRLMSKDPQQRYGSVADVLADMKRLKDNKPMAPLKGGKPAAAPLPSTAPASAPPARASHSQQGLQAAAPSQTRPKSGVGAAVGSRPPSAGRSGFSGAINARKPGSGMGSAVGTSGSALKAIKDGTTGTAHSRIFGRLDTHVKSTIPQSDLEKRGDDLYRQGQLSLALNCWRESYDATPHTGLKVKLELAERDVKREAYNMTLEEARMRLDDGDFAGAIARSREALVSAEDDQQRQEVLNVERQAIDNLEQEKYRNRVKLIVGGIVLLVAAIVAVIFMTRAKSAAPPAEVPPSVPGPAPVAPPPVQAAPSGPTKHRFDDAGASVTIQGSWSSQGKELVYLGGNRRAAVLTAGKLPEGTVPADVLKEIRNSPTMKDQKVIEESPTAMTVDGNYAVAKSVVRYTAPDGVHLHHFYVYAGPENTPRLLEVDGREDQLSQDVDQQIQTVIRTWHYEK